MRLRIFAAAAAAAAIVVGVAAGAAGQLDPSFGTNGGVTTDFAGGTDQAFAVALQQDGKMVVGGEGGTSTSYAFQPELARYNADGSLDPSFGSAGKLRMAFAGPTDIQALALQPDGKVIAAGSMDNASYDSLGIVVMRLNADGSLDASFGSGGLVEPNIPGEYVSSVVIQPDGKILVAGARADAGFTAFQVLVRRFNTNGTPDATFGSNGVVTSSFGGTFDSAGAVVLQLDGKIVVAGSREQIFPDASFAVTRLLANGATDTSFGTGGVATASFAQGPSFGARVALQSDGKIVVSGEIGDLSSYAIPASDIGVARFNSNGSLDTSFANAGTKEIDFGQQSPGVNSNQSADAGVAVQPDGKIILIGSRSDNGNSAPSFLVVRIDSSGAFDPTFGANGVATGSIQGNEAGFAGTLQPDGKIVEVGFSGTWTPAANLDFGVMRFLGDDTPASLVASLRASVDGSTIAAGSKTSLEAKLDAAAASLPQSPKTAANQLDAFANEVRAQSGKKIPAATASQWIAQAQHAAAVLRS
jgi:uncharacterized delta-60 repeat protein